MAPPTDLTTFREPLGQICTTPDHIISVYALEQHIWADSNSDEAKKNRTPNLQTIEEFQIDPVRHFLNDILRNMAAPHRPERRDLPIGQGYWVQAEFGSGKSHLLSFLAAIALGNDRAWEIVRTKEQKAGRGKRESLAQFWDEGLKTKNAESKGIFVVAKTLVGSGGGTVGYDEPGRRLSEYILDAVKDQLQKETGKNISLYPVELLCDRFLEKDLERYYGDLKKFLRDPKYWAEDERWDIDEFISVIQENRSPEYKKDCGNRLWMFYDEYLGVRPNIEAETEDVLKHMVDAILAEGYCGILLLIDEVSLFMKDRDDKQRADDEKTLVVLSNRLAKVNNLPIWTICAAQQAIESRTAGIKNIIANDRLKLVPLLQEENDYYNIVLARVREVTNPGAISGYYNYYRRGFSWPRDIGEDEFERFFPYHKTAIEVLRDITHELTTTRSAIHFMHQTLKHAIKNERKELIRLHDFFDEAVEYEEDPSGTNAGLAAIKTKRDREYQSYTVAKKHIDGATRGFLKAYHDRATMILQTLFLYYIAKRKTNGLSAEDLANEILDEKSPEATLEENTQHYEILGDALRKDVGQIREKKDEENRSIFRFDPEQEGINVQQLFDQIYSEADSNELMLSEAWEHLLGLDEWIVKTRKMTYILNQHINSIFHEIMPTKIHGSVGDKKRGDQDIEILWENKKTSGIVGIRDLRRIAADNKPLPSIESYERGQDFAVFISTHPVDEDTIGKYLIKHGDPRLILWVPDEMTKDERERLVRFATYRKLALQWAGKESDDAIAVIDWVNDHLQSEMGPTYQTVVSRYARGRMDAYNNTAIAFDPAGDIRTIIQPVVDRVLRSCYESREIAFEGQITFGKEDAVKIINGIVKKGSIPKGTKILQNESAAMNFGPGLKITTSDGRTLDISHNRFIADIWKFIETKLTDGSSNIPLDAVYKNFTGIHGPNNTHYGLNPWIIQIFILCLVREGKVRINTTSKAQLQPSYIDYTTIGTIEFSRKILDNMESLQKMEKPENWDVLRPYAEILLNEEIPETADDMQIARYRQRLRDLFAEEKEKSARIKDRAARLFAIIEQDNPYQDDIDKAAILFSHDLGDNDIDMALYGLKKAFEYSAFDENRSDQSEVDDLANCLNNFQKLEKFLAYSEEVAALYRYCVYEFPDIPELRKVHELISALREKLDDLSPFISSDLKLRTELIGTQGDSDGATFEHLQKEYISTYVALHEQILSQTDRYRKQGEQLVEGDEMRVLSMIEGISGFGQQVTPRLNQEIRDSLQGIFSCPEPSRISIEQALHDAPQHTCNLTFSNYKEILEYAESAATHVTDLLSSEYSKACMFLLNPSIQNRLKQGEGDEIIDGLLACRSPEDVHAFFIGHADDLKTLVATINRFLKQIIVKQVRISDFTPSVQTIERQHIAQITEEFRQFLEENIDTIEAKGESLPMIKLE